MLTAFALGGLGGNNAHTAGFLAATKDMGLKPDLISCTSGPIYWVSKYLEGKDLQEEFKTAPRDHNKLVWLFHPSHWLHVLGIMRPAIPEYWARWSKPWFPLDAKEWVDRIAPAQILSEMSSDAWFAKIARTLNEAKIDGKPIGIVFNVFEPQTGIEYLHVNDKACDLLEKNFGDEGHGGVKFAEIDGDAVRDSLRLYWYGFESPNQPWTYWFGTQERIKVDGAYHRQIILRDLHLFDRVYAVRPQNEKWLGTLPRNAFEVCDLIFELWFNSSYAGDVSSLAAVNELVDKEKLGAPFKKVDVIQVPILRNCGLVDYFVEDAGVFEAAYEQTQRLLGQEPGAEPVRDTLPGSHLSAVG